MKYNIAKATGLNTDQQAALSYSSAQDDNNLFLAILNLSCDDAFTRGRQLLIDLADFVFDSEASAAEKLTSAFAEAQQKLSDISGYDLLLAIISGKALYLIGHGQINTFLQREGRLTSLLNAQNQLISGFLEDNDRVFLTTINLVDTLGEELDGFLKIPIEKWQDEIEAQIGLGGVGKGGAAGLLLEVQPEDQPQTEAEPVPENLDQKIAYQPVVKIDLKKLLSIYRRILPKSGRGKLVVAAVLILILIVGVGYKFKTERDQEKDQQFNNLIRQATDDFRAAEGLQTLNPAEAATKLNSAQDNINKALVIKPKDQKALSFKKQIEENAGSITQKFQDVQFSLFLDLDLVKKDLKVNFLTLSVGKLLVLDIDSKALIVIDLEKKSHQILAGLSNLGNAKLSSVNGNLAFIYSEDKGLLRLDIDNQKITKVSDRDDNWSSIFDLVGFAGNVYLLDTNQIWKYLPIEGGYSSKRAYLTSETKADFTGAKRMQIESSVYVLKQGGEILRFTRGVADHFALSGLDKLVNEPKSFFVSSDTENLYILDSGNSRLIVVTKLGAYKAQYGGDKFGSATDLVVDEEGKKVYLLEGSKIWQMELK